MAGEKESILNMLESKDPVDNKLAINILYYDGMIFKNLNILVGLLKKTVANIKKVAGGDNMFGNPRVETPEETKERMELLRMIKVIYARNHNPGYRGREKKLYAKQKGRV